MNSLDPHPHSVMKNSIHSVCDLSKEWMKSLRSSILSLVKSHPRISTITIIGTGTGTVVYLLYRIWKSKGSSILRLVKSHPWIITTTIIGTGSGTTVFLLYCIWKETGSSIFSLVKAHPRIITIAIIGTGTGTTVFLLYCIWKETVSSILSFVKSHLRLSTITIIGTGTSTVVYFLYRIWEAKGSSISSSTMFHHWRDIIIINTGTTLFILWNAKEQLQKTMEQLQKKIEQLQKKIEQLQKEIEKTNHSEAEHGKLRTQIEHGELRTQIAETADPAKDQLQTELQTLREKYDQLQTKLHQLQNELEWRKARNETDDITLDAGTAHPNLSMSGDKKSLKHEAQPQKVPFNTERFDSTVCVLGFEGFSSGKHYWEVDVERSSDWDLGVARKSIQRKGKLSLSPKEGFWALGLSGRDYWAKTDPWTRVTVQKKPQKIGVYLSYQERWVTFFNVTDMSVLFTFNNCSFSGEIYPFFKNSHKETTMRVCSIKEESM